ncbi:MAG: hypothetical protein CEE42_02145 [Promethearchaeota archaeon Loki_b31]|nr:MAG: hypothetical protein CEE42_02145 [Candidatus Lokiarchaeota archaeon Loki_b31]
MSHLNFKKKKSVTFFIISLLYFSSIFSSAFMNIGTSSLFLDENIFGNNDDLIELKVTISEILIEDKESPTGEIFQRLSIEGSGNFGQTGSPSLPFKVVKILLPYGKDMADVEIITGETQILEGSYKIEPVQEQTPISSNEVTEFKLDNSVYNSINPFPDKQYSIVGVYELRGYRILVLNLYPVSYVPKTGKVSYFRDITVLVRLTNHPNANLLFRNLKVDEKRVVNTVDNPELVDVYRGKNPQLISLGSSLDLPPGSYDYIIITNEALHDSIGAYTFQDLRDSKNAAGIQTTIVTTEYIYANYLGADNPEKIRNFIIDAYQTWGVEYVLLGGDGDEVDIGGESGDLIIPSRGFYATAYGEVDYDITSDLYYAGLDGNWNTDGDNMWAEPGEDDLYAEVYVGRAPVDSEDELSNFVYKTLAHETETHHYLSDVLMVGEDLYWYVWGGDYKDEVKDGSDAQGYTTEGFPLGYFVDTLYDRELDPARWDKNDLIPLINDGIHIINHLGHCDVEYSMKMENYDADSLTNDHYFFGYSQGCYNGAFDNRGPWGEIHANDSIVEHFVTTPHGAFAFIANSRFGWGDPYGTNGASQYYDRQFFDAIFSEGIEEIGRANQDSKEDNIGFLSQEAMRWVYYELNLFGDPTATIPPQPNDFTPSLTDGSLSPTSGNQTTLFTYNVTYTDADNNPPIYINVLINETSYPMEKQDLMDEDYTDGCKYNYFTYLQPGNYNYSFECADYKFFTNTGVTIGPSVSESPNLNSPILSNGQVSPPSGVKHWDTFKFSVIYSDADNNLPEYVNIILNSITYPMAQLDYLDSNYMDGCVYTFSTTLHQDGDQNYSFECSDGDFTHTIGPFSGPSVYEILNYTMIPDYEYNWIDASGGTELLLGDDDYAAIALPFNFQFYNETFSTIYLCSNGYLSFTDTTPYQYSNVPFPSANPTHTYMIAPFWDDIYPASGGHIYVQSFGTYWVAEWQDIYHINGPLLGSFELILYESGEIIFNYDYIDYIDPYTRYTCGLNLGEDTRFYNSYQDLTTETEDFSLYFYAMTNDFAPELSLESVIPTSGYQNTLFNFNVTYTDQDNNPPVQMDVIINGTTYPMEKQNPSDDNYTDGCLYQLLTYFQPAAHNYTYYFNCYDGIFTNTTTIYSNIKVEETNIFSPSLSNEQVLPNTGYAQATIFSFMVTYTDPDNNAPDSIEITINSTTFTMLKQDFMDSNFMDGCVYIYNTQLNDIGIYLYNFSCSDGIFTASAGPFAGPVVEKGPLFDSMYIDHYFSLGPYGYDSTISYSTGSTSNFKAHWAFAGMIGSWDIDLDTRIMSNCVNPCFVEGTHTPFWISTNTTLNDIIPISVMSEGDHNFQVSDELLFDLPEFGLIDVWELEDLTDPGGVAWYEKSTGILLNGIFFYGGGAYSYTFDFIDTNVEFTYITFDHELKVSLDVPTNPKIDQTYIINATVTNNGLNDEYDVDLLLYLDDVLVDSITISSLPVGASETVNYMWTPTEYKTYNFTAYAPPVPDESYIDNNIKTKLIPIRDIELFDGMYIDHIWTVPSDIYPSRFSYSYYSGSLFIETWDIMGFSIPWYVDSQTRLMSGGSVFGDGTHTPAWIFTDVSLGDEILIAVVGEGDHLFSVAGELIYDLPGFGSVGVWVLEDLTLPGGVAWYEKSTGILLKGTFFYGGGAANYTFDFVSTNVEFTYVPPGDFELSTNAGTPSDNDGNFDLTWESADGALTYSVYQYSSYITEINGSLTLLGDGITELSHALSGYTDGTYYFIAVAHNAYGDTRSNCIEVVVQIPSDGGIPGYYFVIAAIIIVAVIGIVIAIIIIKRRK